MAIYCGLPIVKFKGHLLGQGWICVVSTTSHTWTVLVKVLLMIDFLACQEYWSIDGVLRASKSQCSLQAVVQGEMFSISCIIYILKYKFYDILYSPLFSTPWKENNKPISYQQVLPVDPKHIIYSISLFLCAVHHNNQSATLLHWRTFLFITMNMEIYSKFIYSRSNIHSSFLTIS